MDLRPPWLTRDGENRTGDDAEKGLDTGLSAPALVLRRLGVASHEVWSKLSSYGRDSLLQPGTQGKIRTSAAFWLLKRRTGTVLIFGWCMNQRLKAHELHQLGYVHITGLHNSKQVHCLRCRVTPPLFLEGTRLQPLLEVEAADTTVI